MQGAELNVQNRNGETPLHAACFRGNATAVAFLLEMGAAPNATNRYARRWFDGGCLFRHADVCVCSQGETCLHYSVRAGARDLARMLLRYGADPHISGSALQVRGQRDVSGRDMT